MPNLSIEEPANHTLLVHVAMLRQQFELTAEQRVEGMGHPTDGDYRRLRAGCSS